MSDMTERCDSKSWLDGINVRCDLDAGHRDDHELRNRSDGWLVKSWPSTTPERTDPAWLDAAVEAGSVGIKQRLTWASMHWDEVHPDAIEHIAKAALLAALPAITGGVAAAIEAERADGSAVGDATFNDGMDRACRTARVFGSDVTR